MPAICRNETNRESIRLEHRRCYRKSQIDSIKLIQQRHTVRTTRPIDDHIQLILKQLSLDYPPPIQIQLPDRSVTRFHVRRFNYTVHVLD